MKEDKINIKKIVGINELTTQETVIIVAGNPWKWLGCKIAKIVNSFDPPDLIDSPIHGPGGNKYM